MHALFGWSRLPAVSFRFPELSGFLAKVEASSRVLTKPRMLVSVSLRYATQGGTGSDWCAKGPNLKLVPLRALDSVIKCGMMLAEALTCQSTRTSMEILFCNGEGTRSATS